MAFSLPSFQAEREGIISWKTYKLLYVWRNRCMQQTEEMQPEEVRLPKLHDDMSEAKIVFWFFQKGEVVYPKQLLVRVETNRAFVDITSPASTPRRILRVEAKVGQVLNVGGLLAVLGSADS